MEYDIFERYILLYWKMINRCLFLMFLMEEFVIDWFVYFLMEGE